MLAGALAGYAVAAETGQPVGRRRSPAPSPAALLALVHALLRAVAAARTNSPPASSCCSSASGSPRCSASPTCRPSRRRSRRGRPGAVVDPVDRRRSSSSRTRSCTSRTSLVPAVWWVLFRSRWGLLLRAAGERAEVLVDLRPPRRARSSTPRSSSAACSPASAVPSSRPPTPSAWFENMAQGRGFIAVAVVIFAARHPFKVAGGAYLFGAASPCRRRCRPGVRHQPVRPRRHPLRRHARRPRRPRPPTGRRGTRRPHEGLRDHRRAADPAPPDRHRHQPPRATNPRHTMTKRHHAHCRGHHSSQLACGSRRRRLPCCDPTTAARCQQRRDDHRPRRPTRRCGDRGAAGTGAGQRRRSASSSSARRTTTATTRRPTKAARPSPRPIPDLEVLTAENVPEDDNATRVMEDDDRQGRQDHLRHELRPPRPGDEGRRRPPRRRRRAAGQLHQGRRPGERRHLLRHGVRAGVPRRHRGRQGHQDEQARLRLRLPDPADDRQHQRLRARRPVGEPRRRDLRGQHVELV